MIERSVCFVDFVVKRRDQLLPIEVKATARPGHSDAKGLRTFRDEYADQFVGGLLLHAGDETFWISDGILATPWWRVL